MTESRQFSPGIVLMALTAGLVLVATLTPVPNQAALSALTPWWCLLCGDLGTVDVILNLALFVPFGAALGWSGIRPPRAALIALLFSIVIELLQHGLVPGRDASLSDVLTNTAGAWIGAGIGGVWTFLWRPDRVSARRLALGASVGWLGMLAFTAWAVRPSPPPGEEYVARWAPDLPLLDRFRGRVDGAELDGLARAPGPLDAAMVRSRIATGHVTLSAHATGGPVADRLAPIVEVAGPDSVPVLRLGKLGQKAVFTVRSRARGLLLRDPYAKAYRAFSADPAAPVTVEGGLADRHLMVATRGEGAVARADLPLTPGLGWMLVLPLTRYPFDYRPEWTSAVWVALPLLLVGFWEGRRRTRPGTCALAGLLLLGAGLAGTAAVLGAARDGWHSWLASATALALGWCVGRYAPGDAARLPPRARSAASP